MQVRPGYKQTEVGVIPEAWDVVPVATAGHVLGGRQRSPNHHGRLTKYLRVANVFDGFIDTDNVLEMPFSPDEQERFGLEDGDILLNEGQSIDLVGRSAMYEGDPPGCCFQNTLIRFRAGAHTETRFAHLTFQRYLRTGVFASIALQTTSIAHLGAGRFAALKMALPPLPEQLAIAEALGDVDALLGKLDVALAKKRDLKQAAMQQLLAGNTRLPGFAKSHRTTRSGIGLIPADWKVGAVGRAIERLDAGASVNSERDDAPDFGSHPCILKTGAVKAGSFDPRECKKVAKRDLWRLKVSLRRGTILVSRMNTVELVGESGYVCDDYPNLFVPDRMWMSTIKSGNAFPRWLSYVLAWRPVKSQISDAATGTSGSMKNISKPSFRAVEIPYPPEEEQRAIAAVLYDIDAEIAALEARRDKTRLLKQAMMQELLTGRTRLV